MARSVSVKRSCRSTVIAKRSSRRLISACFVVTAFAAADWRRFALPLAIRNASEDSIASTLAGS
jgi:hypothetical protein